MISAGPEEREVDVLGRLRAALEREVRIDLTHQPLKAAFDSGTLTLAGELASIAQKKKVLRCAGLVPGVAWLVDRLTVAVAEHMSDAQIRDHLYDALQGDPVFSRCAIYGEIGEERKMVAEPSDKVGEITVIVDGGIVTLDGEVPSRAHKRLAGVLAWWVPGSRDVVDGLAVAPQERDSDEEITDAVRTALEKDPFVEAGQVRVTTAKGTVTLTGWVRTVAERDMAENDAWFVFGVADVANRIEVD